MQRTLFFFLLTASVWSAHSGFNFYISLQEATRVLGAFVYEIQPQAAICLTTSAILQFLLQFIFLVQTAGYILCEAKLWGP